MYKALVIDDDPIFQYIAEKIFKKTQLFESTLSFFDGASALDYLQDNKDKAEILPDIILLDLYMPNFNGWDFLNEFDEIRAGFKKIMPVYILTSSVDPREISRSKQFDFVKAFTSKPMTYDFIENLYRDCQQMDTSV